MNAGESIGKEKLVRLATANWSLTLAPALGGAITRLDYCDRSENFAVLRGSGGFPATILDAASFPLVPYCNRIRGGRFRFRGREVTLARNMAGDPSPLHGQGWLNTWEVVRHGTAEAELRFRHVAGEWPWDYEARQIFRLDGMRIDIDLFCLNLDGEPMPCGLGQHPYFPCDSGTMLDTVVTSAWTIDDKVLPVEQVPATDRYDLRARPVCGQDLDNGFGGWGGEAWIDDPARPFRIRMSSPDARFFQLYSPAAGRLFVAEPVSHANAALNAPESDWPALGLRVLEQGEEMRLRMRIELVAT